MPSETNDTRIVSLAEIERVLPSLDVVGAMERAFCAYSEGRATVPPVSEILFTDPPGEAHIKAGYIAGDDVFVVKVATGFYRNPALGLSSSSGLMTVFDSRTGFPKAILLDNGKLTDLRTAAAGAVAARLLAPSHVQSIAIIGSGIQARLQASLLRSVTACRTISLWARDAKAATACAADLSDMGFAVSQAGSAAEAASKANIVVTCTASREPLLGAGDIKPGTHITAVGADSEGKQELSAGLLMRADVVAADSLPQAMLRGDISHALAAGMSPERIIELGAIIAGQAVGRTSDDQITIADLTGVAAQDIEIAKAVLASIEAA